MGVCAADLLEDGVEARGPSLVDSTGEDGTSDGGAGGSEFGNAVDMDGDFVWLPDVRFYQGMQLSSSLDQSG